MLVAHHAFHVAVAAACGNPLLELVTLPLHASVDRSMIDPLGRDFWVRVDADHRAILAAIAAQRPDEAQAAAEEHMREVRRVFLDASRSRPPFGRPPEPRSRVDHELRRRWRDS